MSNGNCAGDASQTRSGWAIRLDFDDVLDFTEHVRPWQVDFTQIRRGRFQASGFIVSLGRMTFGSVHLNQPTVRRVRVPPGQYSVFAIRPDSDPTFLGAQGVRVGDCVTVPGGTGFEAVTRGQFAGVAFSFDADLWHSSGEWFAPLPEDTGPCPLIENVGEPWAKRLYALVDCALEAVSDNPRALDDGRIRAVLTERILQHVRSGHRVYEHESTEHRARARRRAAVQRAREFIDARLSEPIRLEQVCRYACAQSRTLEYGFREVFDTPMVSYIKALRMNRVHKLLRCPSQSHRTVSELALDTGFWHLSQFASDYKKFFGESPSQTHRRAGGATGPRLSAAHA
jgi:AraC family transcriptional regulator, ethanolamine operon transcriptional activator